MGCAWMILDLSDPSNPVVVEDHGDPDFECSLVLIPGAVVPECSNIRCDGECVMEGPTHVKDNQFKYTCCCGGETGCCGDTERGDGDGDGLVPAPGGGD